MTPRLMTIILAGLLLVPTVRAEPVFAKEYPDVANSSYVEPNGDRTIQLSVTVPAAPNAVFEALSTIDGWKSWAAPFVIGDARVGGILETSYDPNANPGAAANIKNQIVAWIPASLVVLRNVQAPEGFPHAEDFLKTVTVIQLAPDGQGTRVTLSNVGYGKGEGFDQLYAMFTWDDAYALEKLKQRFENGPIDWKAEIEAAGSPGTKGE